MLFRQDKEATDFIQVDIGSVKSANLDKSGTYEKSFVKRVLAMFSEMIKQDMFVKGLQQFDYQNVEEWRFQAVQSLVRRSDFDVDKIGNRLEVAGTFGTWMKHMVRIGQLYKDHLPMKYEIEEFKKECDQKIEEKLKFISPLQNNLDSALRNPKIQFIEKPNEQEFQKMNNFAMRFLVNDLETKQLDQNTAKAYLD